LYVVPVTVRDELTSKTVTNISDPRYVKALSHPLRVRILALLQERTASPRELAEWLDATLGTVSYHVRTLHDFGLIELVKTTQVRGAIAHHYKATIRPTVDDAAWASAPPIAKQAAVGASLQTVDDYARASAAAGGFDRAEAHLSRSNVRLDAKGWQAADKACQKLIAELGRIEEAAAKRIEKDPEGAGTSDAAVVVMLFEAIRLSGEEPPPAKPKRRRKAAASA
jgi:DNA-binding transcriptional ArsR family regulator